MSTLQEKIKELLEGTLEEKEVIQTKGGATITDDDSDEKDEKEDDHQEPDGDEDGEDTDGDDDGKTKVSKDPGAPEEDDQEDVEVKEDIDPFINKLNASTFNDGNGGADGSTGTKQSKLTTGKGKKDDAGQSGKLAALPTGSKGDDNGDNARLTKNYSKEGSKKIADGATGSAGQNPVNAKNFVDDNQGEGAIDAFGSLKKNEHMEALFNGETLTEEFKEKAQTIFEAAVESMVDARLEQIQEETAAQITEAVEEVKAELVEQIDGFLNLMVEKWMDDNAIALESSMKVELTNSFIDGLKGLFKEHYFDIPEDKIEVVEEQAAEIDGLQSELNEAVTVVEALHTELVALKQKSITESVSGDLTKTERAKFVSLSEKIEFTSEEEYSEKLMTIKESYFPRGHVTSPIPQNDVPALITEESGKQTDEYIAHIAKNLKF